MPSPPSSKQVCVTGSSGFIAHHIVYQLLERGYTVVGTVRDLKKTEKVGYLKRLQEKYGSDRLQLVEADLLKPGSFDAAVGGCTYVIHTASPFFSPKPNASEKEMHEQLVDPAVKGTENVFNSILKNKETVKRVVLTSSVAALANVVEQGKQPQVITAEHWNSLQNFDTAGGAYSYSKTAAEQFAWNFARQHFSSDIALACIHPSMVIGSVLPWYTDDILKESKGNKSLIGTSMMWLCGLLTGQTKEVPYSQLGIVNVKDVARAHIEAMEREAATGKRFPCSSVEKTQMEYCQILKELYPSYPVTSKLRAEDADPQKRIPLFTVDTSPTKDILGIHFIGAEQTLKETGDSLISFGFATLSE